MSRVFEQYSTEEKIHVLKTSSNSLQSRLTDALDDVDTLSISLCEAIDLLERAYNGKPFKKQYKLYKKYLQQEEV